MLNPWQVSCVILSVSLWERLMSAAFSHVKVRLLLLNYLKGRDTGTSNKQLIPLI